jgi:toluene monooxygenase electron transfer component
VFSGKAPGARLALFGPLGKATYHPDLARNLLCIAGGSGIAGMMSILSRACAARHFERHEGHVFFGVRTMKDTFYLDALSAFRNAFPQALAITVALSDEDVPASAGEEFPSLAFTRGLVHEVAKREMAGKYQNVRAYLAGPPPAVDAAIRVLLLEAKLTTDNIRYDKFS